MGVDTKEIGKIIWEILGFSMNTTLRFIQNHPFFSGVSVFLLFLYIFLPSVFYFLIYSSPILACLAVFVLNKFTSRRARPQNAEERPSSSSESKNSGSDDDVSKSHLRHQRSVRRNARRKVEKWDSHASEEEKDKVILTSLYNDLLGRTPQFEDSPKAVETDIDKNEASPGGKSPQKFGNSGMSYRDLVVLGGQKPASGVCETEEVGDQEDRSGQKKNRVMEPGISEAERNRRLESLIARRRAKRLFKLALDQKHMMNGGEKVSAVQSIAHISVSRDNGGLIEVNQCNSSDGVCGLQLPGSAPSVLLPARNPFDLPYDPQEEKPNLKGDSFDEEFSAITQKDMFFSRHESFCCPRLFSVEPMQDANRPDLSSDVQRTITRTYLDTSNDDENQTAQEVPQEGEAATTENNVEKDKDGSDEIGRRGKTEAKVEEQLETDSNKEDYSGSSSSEESEQEFNSLNRAELREAIRQTMGKFPDPFGSYPRSSIPSPLPRGIPPRIEDHNMFYAARCADSHARTFSIASDLQVEVSEISSPPTTVDWHDDSSNDGESYMYDTDIDKEIAHCGEELQKRGSRQLESKPRAEAGAKEEDGSEVEFSGIAEKPAIPVSQSLQVVEKSKGTIHTSKSLSSIAEEPEIIIDSIEGENQENVKPVFEELDGHRQYWSSPDSFPEKLAGEEADMQDSEQKENEILYGSTVRINSEAFEHADERMEEDKKRNFSEHSDGADPAKLSYNNGTENGSNNIPADQGMKLVQEFQSRNAIDGQSVLKINQNLSDSATLAQPTEQLLEKEMKQDGVIYSRKLDNAAENIESKSIKQAEREAVEEPKFVENTNKEELAEHEDNASDALPGHQRTESLEAYRDVEEASEVLVSQVNEVLKDPTFVTRIADPLAIEEKQKDNSLRFSELNKQEILKEGKDDTEPVQVYNKENVGESVVSEDIRNSNDSVVVTKGAEALTQEVPSSPSPGSSSSPMDHTSSTSCEEVEKINDSHTDAVDTTRVEASYKQPPIELVTRDAMESMLKSIEFSAVQPMYDKDFQEPEVPSDTHETSAQRVTAETSYEIVEPEETTDNSQVRDTQENKEGIMDSSGGLASKGSDMDNFVKDEDHSSKLTLADEATTQQPKPRDAVTSDIVKDITGYSPELVDTAAVNVSRELSEVFNDSKVHTNKEEENQKPVEQCGEAKENASVKEEEELGKKSDTLHNSAGLVAREEGEEPIREIETMDIADTSKEADAEGTTETTKHGDKVSDLS